MKADPGAAQASIFCFTSGGAILRVAGPKAGSITTRQAFQPSWGASAGNTQDFHLFRFRRQEFSEEEMGVGDQERHGRKLETLEVCQT